MPRLTLFELPSGTNWTVVFELAPNGLDSNPAGRLVNSTRYGPTPVAPNEYDPSAAVVAVPTTVPAGSYAVTVTPPTPWSLGRVVLPASGSNARPLFGMTAPMSWTPLSL